MSWKILIEINDVSEGDVTDLAQHVWDENAESFDANSGDFKMSVSKDGFPVDWTPVETA